MQASAPVRWLRKEGMGQVRGCGRNRRMVVDQGPCHACGEAVVEAEAAGWGEVVEEDLGSGKGSQGGVSTWYRRDPSSVRIQASRERAKATLRSTMDLIPCRPLSIVSWCTDGPVNVCPGQSVINLAWCSLHSL